MSCRQNHLHHEACHIPITRTLKVTFKVANKTACDNTGINLILISSGRMYSFDDPWASLDCDERIAEQTNNTGKLLFRLQFK